MYVSVMNYQPSLLYGVRDDRGSVHLSHRYLVDRGQASAQEAYCGRVFDMDAELVMPYSIRSLACRRCVDAAFPLVEVA